MPKKYVHFTDEQKEQARQTSPSVETYGFISMISKAAMPLTSSEGSITRITPKQFHICSAAATDCFQYLHR